MDNLKLALNHGLKEEEYKKIVENLGREPNPTEIGIFAAMWSEHCSYKSSKVHLKKLPTKGERVIQGPGENAGIAGYGNCIGIPTVGGEVYFEECYNGNPLVNVFALGVTKKNEIFKGHASGIGNPVIYVGSKTGRDGIHGAVMASETFTREAEEKRPAVQVGDPFTEKLLLEACLELFKTEVVVGIQDMGAAGLTSSSVEMAGRGGTGITLNIDKVPRRETAMTPYEVMLSESQERMLLVVQKGKEELAERIFRKWALDFAVIGEVTDSQRIKGMENGKTAVDLPIKPITKEAPLYRRPNKKPIYLRKVNKPRLSSLPIPNDMNAVLLKLISSPNLSHKRWICEQYDHMVRTNTIVAPGSDAAVIGVKGTDKALALTSNGTSRTCYLAPYVGSMIAVAESARNLACSGAKPLAITDCLNFGNPEKPEIMWQFKRSVEGMAEAARRLGTPVVSGNVSFYNETENKAIYPTPTVHMVGLIENLRKHITQWFKKEGDILVLPE